MDAIKTKTRDKFASFRVLLTLLLLMLCLSSCDSQTSDQKIDRLADEISKHINEQAGKLGEFIPSKNDLQKASSEEIEKVFAIEYKVEELSLEKTTEEIQTLLSQLGKDRWDCNLTAKTTHTLLMCKRRPNSALRTLLGAGAILW